MTWTKLRDLAARDAPRWAVWLVVLVLVACAAGGLAQLVDPPVHVERETEVKVVTRTRVEWRERVEVETRDVTKWRTIVREVPTPVVVDGGVRVVVVRETVTEAVRDASTSTTSDAAARGETSSDTATREVVTATPVLPSWRLGVQVGASWATPSPAVPGAGPLVLGLEAAYRLPLPLPPRYGVWAGVWAGTYGAAGVGVSVEF